MKKLLLAVFAMMIAVVSFVACEGPEGPQGPEGKVRMESHYFEVRANQWEIATDGNGDNLYYYHTRTFNALDDYIYDEGLVVGYTYLNYNDPNNEVMIQLGRTFPIEEYANNQYYNWIETIDAEYYPGEVTFIIRISDFRVLSTNQLPAILNFKVVLVW